MIRLLVVDDEPDIAFVLRMGLENNAFAVDSFTDPLRAIHNFKEDYYAMVITDIRMPKMNGFELYRELKKKDDKIKVAFMTAFDIYHSEFNMVFKNTDVKLFFKKPVTLAAMIDGIRQELNSP